MTVSTLESRSRETARRIPPLRSGDHLTRDEFERRYAAMPDVNKAELIVEIAARSASYDLHEKLNAYRRNGVREYVVWRVWDAAIDWYVLRAGRFEALPLADGVYRSETFPGLWLAPEAVLRGDLARVLAVLQEGLASPAHAAFVAGAAKT